jgi:hypothetical protein
MVEHINATSIMPIKLRHVHKQTAASLKTTPDFINNHLKSQRYPLNP